MKTKRKWTLEEMKMILKEALKEGVVVTCNKHGIYPATYYSWRDKQKNGTLGLNVREKKQALKKLNKLKKENARLKKTLEEKKFEYDMLMIEKKRR